MSAAGRFITLEGGEGVGKSTQARLLVEWLRGRGLEVEETREPGGTPGAEAIRALVLEGTADRWTPKTEALLFAAARADHVTRRIAPALAAGRWVVCDRFLDSTLAYQGGAEGVGVEAILGLNQFATDGLGPELTLILTLPEEEAAARAAARDRGQADRIGGRDPAFHARVASAFVRRALDEPARCRLIDARGTAEEVAARISALVEPLL